MQPMWGASLDSQQQKGVRNQPWVNSTAFFACKVQEWNNFRVWIRPAAPSWLMQGKSSDSVICARRFLKQEHNLIPFKEIKTRKHLSRTSCPVWNTNSFHHGKQTELKQ